MKDNVPNPVSAVNIWEIQLYLDSVKKLNRQASKDKKPAVLSDGEIKDLIDILAQKYVKQEYLSAYEVSKIMPEITRYFPATDNDELNLDAPRILSKYSERR